MKILEDDVILLEQTELTECFNYMLSLIMKCRFTRLTKDEAKKALMKFPILAWIGYEKKTNQKIGIVYLTHTDKFWTLDAYRDDELVKEIGNEDYSYRAGKLVSDYAKTFTDTLMTMHAFENRAATIVCKKLGFKEDFIILKKETT